MEISIPNNKTPKWATRAPFAEFRLVLRRDGEGITLFTPPPKCYRDFSGFTGAEKDAYNAVLAHVVDTAGAAMREAVRHGRTCRDA